MSSESLLSVHEQEEQPSVGILRLHRNRRAMEAMSEHQKVKLYKSFYSFTTSMGVGLIALILFWIIHYRGGFAWQSQPDKEFNWHPLCMFVALVFCFSQAILIYRTGRNMPKTKLKYIHTAFHVAAFIFSVVGLKAAFDSHNLATPPKPNLYTMHSWLGLTTILVYSLQLVIGFVSFLYPGLSQAYRKAVMDFHVPIGLLCFCTAIVTVISGFTEKAIWTLGANYGSLPAEAFVFNFIAFFTVMYGMLVIYLVFEPVYKRNPLPEDHMVLTDNTE